MSQLENTVQAFVESEMSSFAKSDNLETIDTLEHLFNFKTPNSYRMLLNDYDFDSFSLAGIEFYGSYELLNKIQEDEILFQGLVNAKLMPIGRPECWSYDPICFDGNAKRVNGELPLVRVWHESILKGRKVKIIKTFHQAFPAMMRSVL